MPEISIIVPIYNREERISKCIESILNQTYKDFELILVNDGSTDNSYDICKKYEKADKRVRLFNRKNSGVSASRNFGIKQSQGKYVMFCDSDDTVDSKWCEVLYNAIKLYPKSFICCAFVLTNSEGEQKRTESLDDKLYSFLDKKYYSMLFKLGVSGAVWNKIFSLDIIMQNNICFNEELSFAEDVKYCEDYFAYCESICYCNAALYYYYLGDYEKTLSKRYYYDFYDKIKLLFEFRKDLISDEFKEDFCKFYFFMFLDCLENTFDKRNKWSLLKKIKYNQYVINDASFVEVLNNYNPPKCDEKFCKRLKKGNYLPVYLARVKSRLLKRIKLR